MKRVGPYVYQENDILGQGGFGTVYKGHHRNDVAKQVAIKVVPKYVYQNYIREQEIHQNLRAVISANIVRVFGCYEYFGELKMVMEYCNSGNLAQYLRSNGCFNNQKIRSLIKQIASGMSAIQNMNIIHRDIKPENILLDCQNGCLTFKIADFGVATVFPGGFNQMYQIYLTQIGTVVYMAPEIILNKAYNAKVDLWSIGVVIYQCLTGSLPINTNDVNMLFQYYMNPAFIIQIPAGLSSCLSALLSGLLRVNPQNRISFDQFFYLSNNV